VGEEDIGQLIKRLREERGLSQRKLADLAGIDRGYICQLEAGKAGSITLRLARALAKALDKSPSVFFGEEVQLSPIGNLDQIPVYTDFPVHAGTSVEPVSYVYREKTTTARKSLEGYIVHGGCLKPSIQDSDIIVVDREGAIDNGDIVACLIDGEVHLGRLRKIAGEFFLENNHRRFKLEGCSTIAPVIQVVRRLK